MKFFPLLLIVLLLSVASVAAADEIAVIVNKENSNAIDRALITKIYTGKQGKWPKGGNATILELPEDNHSTGTFNAKVLGMSTQANKDLWAKNVFTGKAVPPRQVSSDEEMKRNVARNKNAIGYISAAAVDDSVRVVMKMQ